MNERLGNYIKDGREKLGISQRELARRVDVDNTAISRIEKGLVYKPNYLLITKICFELNLELLKLLEFANYSLEECQMYGLLGISSYFDYAGMEKEEKYQIIDENGNARLSVIKILNGYKNNELSLKECVGLLSCILNIDIREYLTDEELEKYDLFDVLKFINR